MILKAHTSLLVLVAAGLGMSACSPRALESTPVEVQTGTGKVVCQLYSANIVYWDRAIQTPQGMSPDQADEICRAEGQKQSGHANGSGN